MSQRPTAPSPSALSSPLTSRSPTPSPSSTRPPTPPQRPLAHLPDPLASLRRRRNSSSPSAPATAAAQPPATIPADMFSNRKYTPLPTSSNPRKRAGGGLTAWKRYLILGVATIVLALFGWTLFSKPASSVTVYDETNTYDPEHDSKPHVDDDSSLNEPQVEDNSIYKSPDILPGDHKLKGGSHNKPGSDSAVSPPADDEDDEVPESKPEPTPESKPHHESTPPLDDEDEENEETPGKTPAHAGNHPTSFETDKDAASTTYCTKPFIADKPIVQYALTIDAGSTGSRIHVYKFHNCEASPQLEYETFKMLNPGLSSFKDDSEGAAKSLDPLLEEAIRVVPPSLHHCSPVEVKATAGLRLLGAAQSEAILAAVRHRLETKYKFSVGKSKETIEIMEGKDEGVYAWITANYLLKNIGEGATSDDTLAVMDLGGASTQIVFEPKFENETQMHEGDHRYELKFGGKKYVLYQHSYLNYGLMRARRSVHNLVAFTWTFAKTHVDWDKLSAEDEIANPCLSLGTKRRIELDPPGRSAVNVTMHGGNGGFEACNRIVELVMAKDAVCEVKPCSFNGVYQPSLLDTFPNGKLLALSYFTDRLKPLLGKKHGKVHVGDVHKLAKVVCAGPTEWEKRWGDDKEVMDELHDRPEYCLDLTYMNGLLGLGYELRDDRELLVEKKLNGVELGWALGAGLALVSNAELTCTI
ncbi:Guanosine-diphosphatase [Vanrija albida]|uniref:guanosine-diphosphatase n=1 Tax=Vanrija albida TaxID=181172 RepID=A0ABR3Q8N9_9TREE